MRQVRQVRQVRPATMALAAGDEGRRELARSAGRGTRAGTVGQPPQGCGWGDDAPGICHAAASNGHLHVLQWLRTLPPKERCPWDVQRRIRLVDGSVQKMTKASETYVEIKKKGAQLGKYRHAADDVLQDMVEAEKKDRKSVV